MLNQTLQRLSLCTAGAREQPAANEVSAAPVEDPKTQDLRAKVQALRVLLVRIAMRLTQSLSSSVVQQVNHRCAFWAGELSAVLRSLVHQRVHHRIGFWAEVLSAVLATWLSAKALVQTQPSHQDSTLSPSWTCVYAAGWTWLSACASPARALPALRAACRTQWWRGRSWSRTPPGSCCRWRSL